MSPIRGRLGLCPQPNRKNDTHGLASACRCLYTAAPRRRALRLSVRTPDFHSGKRSSTLLGRTTSDHAANAGGSEVSEALKTSLVQSVRSACIWRSARWSADFGLVGLRAKCAGIGGAFLTPQQKKLVLESVWNFTARAELSPYWVFSHKIKYLTAFR